VSDEFLPTVDKRISLSIPLLRVSTEKVHTIYPLLSLSINLGHIVIGCVAVIVLLLLIVPMLCLMDQLMVGSLIPFVVGILFLCAIFVPVYLHHTKLRITNDGLHFPMALHAVLNRRLFRPWHDLEFVDVHCGSSKENEMPGNILSLGFKSGGHVDLHLARIPTKDLAQLTTQLRAGLDSRDERLPRIDQSEISMTESSVHPLSPASELLPRACLENLNSRDFIISSGHRGILNKSFGLCQTGFAQVGDFICGGEYTVQAVLGANDWRALYLVADHGGQQFHLHEQGLSFMEGQARRKCLSQMEETAAKYAGLEIDGLTRVIAAKAEGERFFLVTDFVKGFSLRDTISQKKTMTEKKALNMVRQLAEILQRLHLSDPLSDPALFAGSIRPDGVVEQTDGRFFIAELGFLNGLTAYHSHLLLHDSAYADLQQLRSKGKQASDLYALGALLYFVLTGHDPQPACVNHVRSVKPALSRSIDELVARLMAPHPLSCSELLYELGAVSSQARIEGKAGEV